MYDEYGVAALLDYLAHQVIVMVMYAAMCSDDDINKDNNFEKVAKLLEKKKAVSQAYRSKLMAIAGQRDSTAARSGAVR